VHVFVLGWERARYWPSVLLQPNRRSIHFSAILVTL
jgi:hypothetical protein